MKPIAPLALAALASCLPAQFVEPGATQLFQFPGRVAGDLFGWRVDVMDDITDDGVPDLVVAAPFHNLNVGRISAHSGTNGAELWVRDETATSSVFGFDMVVIRDLDNDGARDVVASSPFAGQGRVRILSGRTGVVLHTLTAPSGGFSFGWGLASGGDFDGDGQHDLVVADDANSTTGPNAGQLFVYSLPPTTPPRLVPPSPSTTHVLFGTSIAFVGDTNGDGRDDVAVGDSTGFSALNVGRLHVIAWNGTSATFRWTIANVEYGGAIDGNRLSGFGDLDGDGVGDVVVDESFPAHRARAFSGATGALLRTFTDQAGDSCGRGARIVPDQNHDGVPDVLMGTASNAGAVGGGRFLLFSGRDGRRLLQYSSTALRENFANRTVLGPDYDGDGWRDLVVAARGGNNPALSMAAVHVMRGQPFLAGRRAFGVGWPGANGTPSLATNVDPVLGATWSFVMTSSTPAPTFGLLTASVLTHAQPSAWGFTSYVASPLLVGVTVSGVPSTLPVQLPADPGLHGLVFYTQLLVADAAASVGIAASPGLELTFGR